MTEVTIILIALAASAYFSANEITFVVANKIKLEVRAKREIFGARTAKKIIKNPQEVLTTLLIADNIANITFATVGGLYFWTTFKLNEVETLIVITFILLIFGKIIPKAIAREIADISILYFSSLYKILNVLLLPLIKILKVVTDLLLRLVKVKSSMPQILGEEDIKILLKESERVGTVDKSDHAIINRVIKLGDQKVYEAMRPRTEIVACSIDTAPDELYSLFIDSGYSKIPVYENSIDNIVGVVFIQDLFSRFTKINEIIKPVKFYPESKLSIDLLREFIDEGVSIGVVVDEYGGTAGLVTSEDLFEELLGEIKDEYDVEENICRKIGEDTYLISGRSEIENVIENLQLEVPEGNYETFAGYIINKLGKIPAEGEEFNIDRFKISIIKSAPNRIDLVRLIDIKNQEG
jgi:CBS domain containing-hemolysin-like protein